MAAAEMNATVFCNGRGGGGGGGSRLVVTELSHIKQLVAQLEEHLSEKSPDLCKRLTSQIFSLAERSIAIVTSTDFQMTGRKRSVAAAGLASATPSPISDVVDAPFNRTNKKRKMMEKRTHQVRVSPGGAGGETTPAYDGHSWRKYGQKEILGAKHPRSYYRCTHRHSQECMATKQVQRTDEDPDLFDVFYLGTHTCVHRSTTPVAAAGQAAQAPEHKHNPGAQGLLQSLSSSLTVKTEGLAAAVAAEPQVWSAAAPFGFSSTPEQSPFSAPSTSANWGVSPATSDSNHVACSFPAFDEVAAAGDADWQAHSVFQDQEVVSALVAASAPPLPALDFDDEDILNMDISSLWCDPSDNIAFLVDGEQ